MSIEQSSGGEYHWNPYFVTAAFGRQVFGQVVRKVCDYIDAAHERAELAEFTHQVQFDIDFVTQDLNHEVRHNVLETGELPRF